MSWRQLHHPSSFIHTFLMVPSTSQVSLVQPWDDFEKKKKKKYFYSVAARWGTQIWGWLVRWKAVLAKPSWIICTSDLARASSDTLPCGSDAVPGNPMTLQTSVVLPSGSRVLTHTLPAVNVCSVSSTYFLQGGPQGTVNIFKHSVLFNQAGYGLVWILAALRLCPRFYWLHLCHPHGEALSKCFELASLCAFFSFFLQGGHELLILNEF